MFCIMRKKLIEEIEKLYLKENIPNLRVGDLVSIWVKIKEGSKERIQKFDGVIISISGVGTGKSITVRKISSGIGVERVFLIHSPLIDAIKVLSTGKAKIRRAKLYYLRGLQGKRARIEYVIASKERTGAN
jgi:large subunit ribosomal protein L19